MVIGALRCDIRVVVTRYKRVEIIDRTSAAIRFVYASSSPFLFTTVSVTSLAVLNVTFFPWPGWIVNV